MMARKSARLIIDVVLAAINLHPTTSRNRNPA
jgi:hypothetical protein